MNREKFKILGYTNPSRLNGAPINTVISRNNMIYVQFSDSSRSVLDTNSIDELNNIKSFITENKDKYIANDEYSYITYDGIIITGHPLDVLVYLLKDYKKVFDHVHKRMLLNLINKEILEIKTTVEAYKMISLNIDLFCPELRLLVTERIKGNGEKAKRIILQHKTYNNNNFKTSYRKNLHCDDEYDENEISRVGIKLNCRILNEFSENTRFSENNSEKNSDLNTTENTTLDTKVSLGKDTKNYVNIRKVLKSTSKSRFLQEAQFC